MYLSSMSVCEPLGEVVWGVAEILGFPGGERLIGQLPSDQVESVTWRPVFYEIFFYKSHLFLFHSGIRFILRI